MEIAPLPIFLKNHCVNIFNPCLTLAEGISFCLGHGTKVSVWSQLLKKVLPFK